MNEQATGNDNEQRSSAPHKEPAVPGTGARPRDTGAYVARMARAIGEGRVSFDDIRDFDTLVRLKAFMMGWPCRGPVGADPLVVPPDLAARLDEMLARWESAEPAANLEAR